MCIGLEHFAAGGYSSVEGSALVAVRANGSTINDCGRPRAFQG